MRERNNSIFSIIGWWDRLRLSRLLVVTYTLKNNDDPNDLWISVFRWEVEEKGVLIEIKAVKWINYYERYIWKKEDRINSKYTFLNNVFEFQIIFLHFKRPPLIWEILKRSVKNLPRTSIWLVYPDLFWKCSVFLRNFNAYIILHLKM